MNRLGPTASSEEASTGMTLGPSCAAAGAATMSGKRRMDSETSRLLRLVRVGRLGVVDMTTGYVCRAAHAGRAMAMSKGEVAAGPDLLLAKGPRPTPTAGARGRRIRWQA